MARSKNASPNQRIRFERNGVENIVAFGDLGRLLKITRSSRNHTLQHAAEILNQLPGSETTSQATLSRIEQGDHMPGYALAQKLLTYIYGEGILITQDALTVNYQPASSEQLLANLLKTMPELEPSDAELLMQLFQALADRRALKNTLLKET